MFLKLQTDEFLESLREKVHGIFNLTYNPIYSLHTIHLFLFFLFYNLNIVFQGFPIEGVGPMEALMSIFSYDLWTGKSLSVEDIQAG